MESKWILPSVEKYKEVLITACNDDLPIMDRIGDARNVMQLETESDLTDALDILDELNRRFPTKIINDFLNKFRSHK